MLVLENAKSMALKLTNPERVMACIPTAREVLFKGTKLTVIPHRRDEVRVLRNLGIKAPAPILHYYEWKGGLTPYNHQMMTSAFLTMNDRALVLNEIGTGKTQSALWAADYLIETGAASKVLIISPLSTLERVWGDAIFSQFYHRKAVILHGAREKRLSLLQSEADFYIINHDGFGIILPHIQGMFDLVIVDEAAVLRNPSTTRFKQLNRWISQNPDAKLWLMTGTPTPNGPTDAWSLGKLIGNPNTPRTFGIFKYNVMDKIGQYTWVPKANSVDTVKQILKPSVRYTRDECFDLPTTVFQERQVELTKEQKTYYDKMMKDLIVDVTMNKVAGTQITAVTEAVKIQKLVQIACGVAYNDKGEDVEIDCSPRIKATMDVIDEVGGKVIVFVPLTGTLHMMADALSKKWSVGVVNGQVSSSKRNEIFQNFQNSDHPRIIVAHPGTMAHGLTLTAASTIIWYGPINSNEQYVQANGRIERIGKHHTSNVVHIHSTPIERKMYSRLKNKQRLQGLLLETIQQEMER